MTFFQNVQLTVEPVDSMVYQPLYIWHIPVIIYYRLSWGQTMTHITILMSKDLSLFWFYHLEFP